ncbi:MAG: O-acetyl-ADP-ribose deacetylase [Vulcanimicrobiota bacterium]
MNTLFGSSQVSLLQGDITRIAVDGIVNAANARLAGGGGVDGAIHRVGGPTIMQECRKIGGCPVGQAVLTTAGALPAKYVLHTVGPIWQSGDHNEDELLASCYRQCLRLAREYDLTSISFPSISTGVYGFPIKRAAVIALSTVKEHLQPSMKTVKFVCFSAADLKVYQDALRSLST